jgi:hypothetical protein
MTEQMSYNTKALAVPMLIKAKVKFSESNDASGKAR